VGLVIARDKSKITNELKLLNVISTPKVSRIWVHYSHTLLIPQAML
jgi:hypothetical protein